METGHEARDPLGGAEIHGHAPGAVGRAERDERRAGDDGQPPDTGTGQAEELNRRATELRFFVVRNAFYHLARLRHFELMHRGLMFLIVGTGTAGVADLANGFIGQKGFAAITVLLAATDLVLDLRGKAQLHDALKRRYFELLAKLDEERNVSAERVGRLWGKATKITAEEPVAYRYVDALAHNEALQTLGLDEGALQYVSAWQRWKGHFVTGHGVNIPYLRDCPPRDTTSWVERKLQAWRRRRTVMRMWRAKQGKR